MHPSLTFCRGADVYFHAELASDFLTNHVTMALEVEKVEDSQTRWVSFERSRSVSINLHTLAHVALKPGRYRLVFTLSWFVSITHMRAVAHALATSGKHRDDLHLPAEVLEKGRTHCVAFDLTVRMEAQGSQIGEHLKSAQHASAENDAAGDVGDESATGKRAADADMDADGASLSAWDMAAAPAVHRDHYEHPVFSLHQHHVCHAQSPHLLLGEVEQLPTTLNTIRFLDNPHPDGSGPLAHVHHRARVLFAHHEVMAAVDGDRDRFEKVVPKHSPAAAAGGPGGPARRLLNVEYVVQKQTGLRAGTTIHASLAGRPGDKHSTVRVGHDARAVDTHGHDQPFVHVPGSARGDVRAIPAVDPHSFDELMKHDPLLDGPLHHEDGHHADDMHYHDDLHHADDGHHVDDMHHPDDLHHHEDAAHRDSKAPGQDAHYGRASPHPSPAAHTAPSSSSSPASSASAFRTTHGAPHPSVYHMRLTPHYKSIFRFFLDMSEFHEDSQLGVRLLELPRLPECLVYQTLRTSGGLVYFRHAGTATSTPSAHFRVPVECTPRVLGVSHGTEAEHPGRKRGSREQRSVLLSATLDAGALYEVEVSYLGPRGGASDHRCETAAFEVLVHPLRFMNEETEYFQCPASGSDRMPSFSLKKHYHSYAQEGKPANLLIKRSFFYSSERRGERLFLQQLKGAYRSERIVFRSPVPFRFYAELGFDLVAGLMGMRLVKVPSTVYYDHSYVRAKAPVVTRVDGRVVIRHPASHLKSFVHTRADDEEEFVLSGHVAFNKYTVAHDMLPAGSYHLEVFEHRAEADALYFCHYFSLMFTTQPVPMVDLSKFGIEFAPGAQEKYIPLALQPSALRAISHFPVLPPSLVTVEHLRHKVGGNLHSHSFSHVFACLFPLRALFVFPLDSRLLHPPSAPCLLLFAHWPHAPRH